MHLVVMLSLVKQEDDGEKVQIKSQHSCLLFQDIIVYCSHLKREMALLVFWEKQFPFCGFDSPMSSIVHCFQLLDIHYLNNSVFSCLVTGHVKQKVCRLLSDILVYCIGDFICSTIWFLES